jgi:proteasome accessory factor A
MDRAVPFGRIVTAATTHFVTRQVFTGAGKVGVEASGAGRDDVGYQLSQRADFFEAEVGLETTLKRPIINTRDEPHADAQRYRRLHVIAGDANLSEVATFLKVGTTAIVLAMVEDDALDRSLAIRAPVAAVRTVSHDPTLAATIETADGLTMTALEVQLELLDRASKWAADRGLESVGEDVGAEVLRRWEQVLIGLESDPDSVAPQVDWVAKRRLIDGWVDRHGASWSDPRVAALALQYHDLRPERCLARRAGLERIIGDDEATAGVTEPPTDTRAYFRGRCLAKFSESIVAANWDSLVFDVGHEPLRRVPMMEPSRGTEAHVGRLLDECSTPAELVARLSS